MPNAVVALMTLLSVLAQATQLASSPTVVFVCEHGAAKSLIASAYFNKLAAERGLKARAAFRGVAPQDDLSVRTVAGLKADGLSIPDQKPTAISNADIDHATLIFAIACQLPGSAATSGKAASWDDVPENDGYPAMRDAIVRHVNALLDQLQMRK
jgi:protein-tyrosine-phosphatase